jgi:hypothetical protein
MVAKISYLGGVWAKKKGLEVHLQSPLFLVQIGK